MVDFPASHVSFEGSRYLLGVSKSTPYIQGVLNLKNKTETIPVQGGPLPYQL